MRRIDNWTHAVFKTNLVLSTQTAQSLTCTPPKDFEVVLDLTDSCSYQICLNCYTEDCFFSTGTTLSFVYPTLSECIQMMASMMATSQQASRCALTLLLFWVVLSTLACLNFTSCDRGSLADNFGVFHHQFHVNTFQIYPCVILSSNLPVTK